MNTRSIPLAGTTSAQPLRLVRSPEPAVRKSRWEQIAVRTLPGIPRGFCVFEYSLGGDRINLSIGGRSDYNTAPVILLRLAVVNHAQVERDPHSPRITNWRTVLIDERLQIKDAWGTEHAVAYDERFPAVAAQILQLINERTGLTAAAVKSNYGVRDRRFPRDVEGQLMVSDVYEVQFTDIPGYALTGLCWADAEPNPGDRFRIDMEEITPASTVDDLIAAMAFNELLAVPV